MRTVLTHAAAAALAGLLASAVQAADVKPAAASAGPDVHRMLILNGPTPTVHYFSVGLSTGDQGALRDLERAENEANYTEDLQALRRQYVADEIALDPYRRSVQQGLYGKSITRTSSDYLTAGGYGPGYYGYGYSPGYAYGLGYGYRGGYGANFAGSTAAVSQSLAYGVGDEGALKSTMAQVIAGQAASDYATSAGRSYTAAVSRAADSEAVRTALGMNPRGVVAAGAESPRRVTLTLKAGDKVEGALIDEDNNWMTVETAADEVSVRRADVTRIDRHKGGK